ncbi:hypothetical protein EP7_004506 [Isosphaeraceae bacterium EP7]
MTSPALRVCVGIFALHCLSGCDVPADVLARVAVSGRLTLDGAPVENGTITFLPSGAESAVGGLIKAGEYSIAQAEGPVAGSYRVEIRSSKKTGRRVADVDGEPGATVEEFVNDIPTRYNNRSKLTAVIKPGESNQFDFTLESKPDSAEVRKRGR